MSDVAVKPFLQIDLRSTILDHLNTFAHGRPGLDWANYGDFSAYRSEGRRITKQLEDFRVLFAAVAWRSGITSDDLLSAVGSAFSGRLSWVDNGQSRGLSYCTGQYYPTEFRAACCAVLASALWAYWRADVPDEVECKGQYMHNKAAKEFGRGIARRWFL